MEWVNNLEFWHWWIAALALAILELFVSGAVFIWFALGAALVGSTMIWMPWLPWQAQFVLFTIFSLASVIIWRRFRDKNGDESAYPTLNKRGEQYIGRTFTLSEAIDNGFGKVKVDDTIWKISGADLPVGTQIKVVDIDGTVFKVEKV